jgi:hypothetical protein
MGRGEGDFLTTKGAESTKAEGTETGRESNSRREGEKDARPHPVGARSMAGRERRGGYSTARVGFHVG